MVTQYLAILGRGAGAGSDPMAETLPHGPSPAPAFPRSAEPGRLICGWPPPSTLSPTAKEFARVSVTSDSFRKMLCAVETDSKDGPLCYWLRVPRLLPFRSLLARVCGSMSRSPWDDGKTTLFSSVVGKLHLAMLDSMTRFFFFGGKMSNYLNMVRLAVLSLRLSCYLFT